jgi:hypothetical protein
MSYDAGLVARIADLLPQTTAPSARQKNVFGGWGFLVGSSAFVIAWSEGLVVKTPLAEYQAALATPGVTPFAPGGERPMGTWVVVSADVIADDPELLEWVQRGLRGIGR